MTTKYMKMPNYYRYDDEREPLGENFEVTEKLDGANFRWKYIGQEKITFGSRKNYPIASVLVNQPESWEVIADTGAGLGKSDGNPPKTFRKYIEFVAEQTLGRPFPEELGQLVFFGEAVGNHAIDYKLDPKRLVTGFAVYDELNEVWRSDWAYWMDLMGIPTVPIWETKGTHQKIAEVFTALTDKQPDELKKMKSAYDNVSRMEGIVFADYENQTFYKHKTKEFTTAKARKTGSTWKSIIDKYGTVERFEKIILKMMNDELGFNKKNPIASVVGHLAKDIVETVEFDEVKKVLRKILMKEVAQHVTSNEEWMSKAMDLKDD
jgi:hypothetical protein